MTSSGSSNGSGSIEKTITTLVDWAVSHGAALHPAIEIYQDALTGLSFRVKPSASGDVQPYEPIVQLPTSLTLSYFNAVSEQKAAAPDAFPAEFLARTTPHVVGRLFLIKEYLKGETSFWYPYIRALPQPGEENRQAWALAPFWPPEEAELLEGTNVEVGVEKIRSDVKRDLEEARELLRATCGEVEGEEKEKGQVEAKAEAKARRSAFEKALTTELYQWAYCIFSSRSFRPSLVLSEKQQSLLPAGVVMEDFSVLLPLFDIGNHDMTTEIRWDLDHHKQQCELKVGKSHRPGEQVFNNYSMKTNAELLLGYGFMIPATEELHNDYTHVRKRTTTAEPPRDSEEYLISLRPLSHPSSVVARSKQTLQLDPSTQVLGSFQRVQPEMVWDIICTLTLPEQRKQLVPLTRTTMTEEEEERKNMTAEQYQRHRFLSGRVDGEARMYLEQTVAIIQHKVLQELERLDETDVEVVGGDMEELTRNQRLALDYRARCRKVLEGVLEGMSGDDIFDEE
ncbi:hypothetical protein QQS21_006891 [Conoideocrella luteorostrata]|uniref:SET domain-containing protein n=1 Tax=Conoideocrella luteorostrata TaxID=1105319 RepID=A0AAJ0CPR4_9HYPO|nr:hypothetical protein QQS21_006891 [Conoideocrella luteorostrata]